MPFTRKRVRTIRHGSTGLVRKTSACGPSAAIMTRGDGGAKIRIPRHVAILEHHELDVVAVGADELVPHAVEREPVLAAAAGRDHLQRRGIEGKVAPAQRQCASPCASWTTRHTGAAAAGRAVNTVVHAPFERVEQALHVAASEARKDVLLLVGFAIAVGVLEIEDVRRSADKHTAVVAGDRGGPRQPVGVDRALVELAVFVGVHQQPNLAEILVVVFRIAAHFDDKQSPVLVEGHRDRIGDQRFGGDLFDAKAGSATVNVFSASPVGSV